VKLRGDGREDAFPGNARAHCLLRWNFPDGFLDPPG
jgi:hypothetical protein